MNFSINDITGHNHGIMSKIPLKTGPKMNKNLQSPSQLTEFAPLQSEEKQQSVSQLISKFFKFGKSVIYNESSNNSVETTRDDNSQEALPLWAIDKGSEQSKDSVVYTVDVAEGRSLPNVLKRISNLLALRSNNLQTYSDSELKQYWMPDSVSKECYECCEKFTTFRRRHHCRVCGQIFCSSCCNQQIPGKIFGCTGDLRVCTYCCKVVLSYLQSSDIVVDLSADLKVLQENLQCKYGQSTVSPSIHQTVSSLSTNSIENTDSGGTLKRKISVGYQEEKFASGRANISYLTSEEKYRALQNSTSLRNLFEEIRKPNTGVILRSHKHRLRTYTSCLLGSELVDWLIYQQKANNRIQSAAICQALLDGGYITCVFESFSFIDGFVLYKLGAIDSSEQPLSNSTCETNNQDEPSWMQFVPQETSTTDSDNDQVPSINNTGQITSSSSYTLDLNIGASTVYLSRPPASSTSLHSEESDSDFDRNNSACIESTLVRTSEQREFVPESGWHNALCLREENGEKIAYNFLTNTFSQHENSLLKQLLSAEGLSLSWCDVLLSLVHELVDVIRPDVNHNAEELDIREYVKFKKIDGGTRDNCELIRGIVCTKNVAHKNMSVKVENPKILLLDGSIVYQRTEGRLMSLEPVLMQEHEFLRNVTARIIALQPNIVLVQRNVSRLAQDILREQGITLVINVKQKVLERISRCTQGDLVTSVDAHIGRPRLGICKKFYIKSYNLQNGATKRLMVFEGLPNAHLGSTVLLRGTCRSDLTSLKRVASLLLFASYNWRLEKSFLMDEFAFLPNTKYEFFDDSKESTPVEPEDVVNNKEGIKLKLESKAKILVEEKKSISEAIEDFSDPLHSYSNDLNERDQKLAVADLPFSNHFRKALDDTILCISPYVVFLMPYLETENGKKCKLRNFFPLQIYFSNQFENNKKKKVLRKVNYIHEDKTSYLKDPHIFVKTRLAKSADSNEIQALLADYRARGGRLLKKPSMLIEAKNKVDILKDPETTIDVLDPRNHQRMAVLFCSFSHESSNAPAFCVNPWVVFMDFYGRNDIPLGCFLERYCFRSSYMCQSKCETPMLKHIRRFVHFSGCVSISLNNLSTESPEENIVMWSWCSKCSSVSPVVPMSTDTWSFSFAKYLELRFHGGIYTRRGNSPCQHSLHHDHYQYFAYKNTVASFKYSVVQLWEISLPSLIIEIIHDTSKQQEELIEETKTLALKGHEIFSLIFDKLTLLLPDEEVSLNLKQQASKEHQLFKQKIDEIQLKLTSPTIENKAVNFNDPKSEIQVAVWKINDALISIKRMLTETVDQWNSKLSEAIHKKEEKKKEKQLQQDLESPSTSECKILEGFETENSSNKDDNPYMSKKNRSLDNCDDETNMLLPKGHSRSQSDSANVQIEDSFDGKKETDRKSVKTIFSLFSSSSLSSIATPFSLQDHLLLSSGVYGPIVVYESEPSSVVAYALNSYDYKKKFYEYFGKRTQNAEQTPSPIAKRKSQSDRCDNGDPEKSSGLLSFLRNKDTEQLSNNQVSESSSSDKSDDSKRIKPFHIEIQFEDSSSNFFCRIFYAEKFANVRKTVLPVGEEAFVRSLSRSVQWNARGGKSGSTFCKTTDDRFILKEMSKSEVQSFLDSANNYFTYMQRCFTSGQATLLGKIVGIYQIIYRNVNTNATLRTYLLVMENLFYNRIVTQKFDLKGSMRNRLVNPDNQDGEIVLLDENLLKMTCDSPLYILPHSKAVLTNAILNDTEFLSMQSVMDYSLLVGLDTEKKELVLGIIDYIRTFTWDKRLETMVKKTGLLGGQGKLPTIMPPQEYQKRFIEAMHRYFLEVPDPWAGLGKL